MRGTMVASEAPALCPTSGGRAVMTRTTTAHTVPNSNIGCVVHWTGRPPRDCATTANTLGTLLQHADVDLLTLSGPHPPQPGQESAVNHSTHTPQLQHQDHQHQVPGLQQHQSAQRPATHPTWSNAHGTTQHPSNQTSTHHQRQPDHSHNPTSPAQTHQ